VNTSGIAAVAAVATALRVLAAVLFAAFNLMPLFGIYAWGWDAFQLLLLYWAETVILFVCTLAHIACIPPQRLGTMIVNGRTVPASRAMMVGFFALHGGIFIAVHLVFLCVLFSGAGFSRLHGVGDFLHTYFVASGAWVPLILVAVAGAIDVLTGPYHPAFVDAFARRLHVMLARGAGGADAADAPAGDAVGSVVLGLYGRIVIMQVAIIFGAVASLRFGTVAPLVIVIGLKTLIDLGTRLSAIFGAPPAPLLSGAPVRKRSPD
jgi:Family of unknown function (DUF6498)